MMCRCCNLVDRMKPDGTRDFYDYCADCQLLIDRAIVAISVARRIGVELYGYSSWRLANDNMQHAASHIYWHNCYDKSEDHLAHAICRLVMEYARNGQV